MIELVRLVAEWEGKCASKGEGDDEGKELW